MSYSIGPELQDFVASKVKNGEYQNQSEVVRDALRRMKREDELHQMRLAELNQELDVGARQLERGEVVSAEASKRRRAALYDSESKVAR
ncbi:MAG: type II toxin-antitoxin system ParD family antitoxin [Candidatus Sericytochromatia bacterium]